MADQNYVLVSNSAAFRLFCDGCSVVQVAGSAELRLRIGSQPRSATCCRWATRYPIRVRARPLHIGIHATGPVLYTNTDTTDTALVNKMDTAAKTNPSKPATAVPRAAKPVDMGYVKLCAAYTVWLARMRDTH